jgi:hypothetical protein
MSGAVITGPRLSTGAGGTYGAAVTWTVMVVAVPSPSFPEVPLGLVSCVVPAAELRVTV